MKQPTQSLVEHLIENTQLKSRWVDTCRDKPYKLTEPCWFIDVGEVTVYQSTPVTELEHTVTALKQVVLALEDYPGGVLRYHEPSQEGRAEELKYSSTIRKNNFGVMLDIPQPSWGDSDGPLSRK